MSGSTEERLGADAAITMQRLEVLAETGIRSDADISWFLGPNGFLRCCQLEMTGVEFPLTDASLEVLLSEVDDHLTVVDGSTLSARALALRTMAMARSTAERRAASDGLCSSLVGQEPRSDLQPLVAAVARDLESGLPGVLQSPPIEASLVVPIVVSTHARGELVRLALRCISGPPGIAPDLVEAPFQRYDQEFLQAMVDAHKAALSGASCRFSLHSARTGLPLDAVTGRSVGLGAAVGMALLNQSGRPSPGLDPRWAFTGAVRPDGTVDALAARSGLAVYRDKIGAARNMTLVLPHDDVETISPLVSEIDCELLGVGTVDHALDLVERHSRGSTAYRKQMVSPRRRRTRAAAVAAAAIALLALAVAVAWLGTGADADDAAKEQIRRENAPLRLEPPAAAGLSAGTVLYFTRTEVTNAAYRLCITSGPCRQPTGRQARPLGDPLNDMYPVTGVTAADAEVFCQWAYGDGWGLPTFDEFRAAVALNYRQFPFGDTADPALADPPQGLPMGRLAAVDDSAVEARELAWLTGNAAEWTRTQCIDGHCTDLKSTIGSVMQGLRVFGISYADADRPMPADWLMSTSYSEQVVRADAAPDWVGFRCLREAS